MNTMRVILLLLGLVLAAPSATMTVGTLSVQTPLDSTIWPRWNGYPVVASAFSNATILHTALVHEPNGAAVTESDVATHRYQHQNQVHYDSRNGQVYIAFTSSGVSEDTGGQQIVFSRSEDLGTNWSTPEIMVPSQSAFDTVGAQAFGPSGKIAMFCWTWIEDGGQLYFVSAVQGLDLTFETTMPGLALLANEVLTNGTFGTLHRISTNAYSAIDGKTTPSFSQDLHDRLYQRVRAFGWSGGSAPGAATTTDWIGFVAWNGVVVSELSAAIIGGDEIHRIITGRTFGDNDPRMVARTTDDMGTNFSVFKRTDVPSGDMRTQSWKSALFTRAMDDGTFLLAGSFTTNRQDMWIGHADEWMRVQNIQMVWTNMAPGPVYPGQSKGGGIAYPSIATDGTNLWIGSSYTKEKIYVRKIEIPP